MSQIKQTTFSQTISNAKQRCTSRLRHAYTIKYAAQYPQHVTKLDAKLIFSAKRRGFSAQTIVNLFQRLYACAGIQGASSHSGRRQFVTKLADQGINARLVQTLARHKHLSTTQRYIDVNENALRNAVELIEA